MGRRSCALLASGALLALAAGVRLPEKAHSHMPALANESRASAGAEGAVSPIVCLARLATSGFSIDAFDRYGEWFDDESAMTLAETGTYTGADGIREYVEYVSDVSPWNARDRTLKQKPDVKSADPVTGECVVNVFIAKATQAEYATLPTTKASTVAAIVQLTFKPKGSSGILISKASVYYAPAAISTLRTTAEMDPAKSASEIDYICSNMKESCADTWAHNGYTSLAECAEAYAALPVLTEKFGGPTLDANSLSCKRVHAAFAFKNPTHCAHISIKPMEDPNGKIKCQTSSEVKASDLFDAADLADFDSFVAQIGLPPEGIYRCDCSKDGRFTWWPGHVNRCVLC